MTRYAQNGGLTRFDEGKSHQENPLGGIPIGGNNSVEENETKSGNFIYSNRIFLDTNIVSQYNLPKSLVGKSIADATKFIDNKFKGRNDKISQSTKNGMLSKIAEAQEAMKPQEPEMEQEDMIDPSQMAFGGFANSTIGQGFGAEATGAQQSEALGAGLGVATSALDLGMTAFGKPVQNTDGLAASAEVDKVGMIGGSALKGATAGMAFGPAGAGIGALIGAGAGLLGTKKADKAAIENSNNFALNTNRKFSDQYAFGGTIDPPTKVKNPDGSYSMINTTTRQLTPGSVGTRIPGTPGSPAVLPSAGGVNSTDPGRNKAFAKARAAGLPTFNYNGKLYNTDIKLATPGKPAVNSTPDIITPSVPPTYETNTIIEPIPNQVYNIQAQRGTAGTGMLRPGIGGGITTDNQYTANKDVANRAINAQQVYNADVNRRYAPVIDDGRSNNSAQIANRNAKAELRRQQLQGTATATEIPTQLGLERKKVEALRNNEPLAYGGKVKKMANGGYYDKNNPYFMTNPGPVVIGPNPAPTESILQQSGLKSVETTVPYTIGTQPQIDISNANQQFTPGPSNLDVLKYNVGKVGTAVNNNLGNLARYAPIAANALQLAQLKKPQGERLDRLSNRYKPEYVDEAQLQNIANQTMNNSVNAIGQSGASQGQLRSSIVGSQLQRTKAISDAYSQATAQNRATNDRAQTFNLGVDQVNLNQSNTEKDINARDKGNYDTQKSKLIGQLGNDVGNVGKEEIYKKIAKTTTGYSWLGEYQKMNPNATPEETKVAAEKAGVLIDDNKTVKKQALGGYLIKNKK